MDLEQPQSPQTPPTMDGPVGLGGWMVLPLLGLVAAPIALASLGYSEVAGLAEVWSFFSLYQKSTFAFIALMNDSPYGLTASFWTADTDHAIAVGDRVETGTVFMNRCDYLDPALVWTGVKDTGKGAALSAIGYDNLTRPKSYHLREKI